MNFLFSNFFKLMSSTVQYMYSAIPDSSQLQRCPGQQYSAQSSRLLHSTFKGSVSRDFLPPFFSCFEPIRAPDKQAKALFEFGFEFAEIFDHKVVSAGTGILTSALLYCSIFKFNFLLKTLIYGDNLFIRFFLFLIRIL